MAKYKLSDIFENDYPVTQKYGVNASYYKQFGFAGHEGVDYATPVGVNILCPFEKGIIIRDVDAPVDAYGGHLVVWDPIQKVAVWYCHLSKNNASIGQEFSRGQIMGQTGNTGNSSGPHLHANFCETDENKNRLNTNNGYKGFLNILDNTLVEWIPITSSPTTPMDYKKMYEDEKKAHDLDNRNKDKEIEGLREGITKKDSEIEALKRQVGTLQARVDNLPAEIAVECQKVKDETTAHLLATFTTKENAYKKQIKDLEGQIVSPPPAKEKPLYERFKGKGWGVKWDAIIEILKA